MTKNEHVKNTSLPKKSVVVLSCLVALSFTQTVFAGISTFTDVTVNGTLREDTTFSQMSSSGTNASISDGVLNAGERNAEVQYQANIFAVDGITSYTKTFETNDDDKSLSVDRIINYESLGGALTSDEKIGVSTVSAGGAISGLGDLLVLCPFNSPSDTPASCTSAAAGSSMVINNNVNAVTQADVNPSTGSLDYSVNAVGDGQITSDAIIQQNVGTSAYNGTDQPGQASTMDYQDTTTAVGEFNFIKVVSFSPQIPGSSSPSPFERLNP